MDVKAFKAMMAEHTMSENSEAQFFAPNTQLWTTPGQEWPFVVGIGGYIDDGGTLFEGSTRDEKASQVEGRNTHPLEHLMSSNTVRPDAHDCVPPESRNGDRGVPGLDPKP